MRKDVGKNNFDPHHTSLSIISPYFSTVLAVYSRYSDMFLFWI